MAEQLSVSGVEGLGAVTRYAAEIDRLNLESRRPNPFLSAAFLQLYGLQSEFFAPGQGELLLVVRRADRVVGLAPLRRTARNVLPRSLAPLRLGSQCLEFLAPADTEGPGVLAAAEDEDSVADAVVDHVCAHERSWAMFELVSQPRDGALYRAVHRVRDRRFRARDIAVEPYSEIQFAWPNLRSYFKALTRSMRSSVSRQARRLYAAGGVELICARGPGASSAWFDAYLDLDERSWKSGTASSIQRLPRRVEFHRELVAGRAGLDPSFVGVVLDGVLVAGLIVGSNETASPARHGAWALEMAYDQRHAALGPGQLLFVLAVGEALDRGDRFLNFMQNFAYYKHRWAAQPVDVVNVQLIRQLSWQSVRAGIGDARRLVAAGVREARDALGRRGRIPAADEPDRNAARPNSAEAEPAHSSITPARAVDGERARRLTAAALAYPGAGVRRLDRALARAYLPFDLE